MKNNEKKGFPYTLIIVILLVAIIYFFTPKHFWDSVGSNSASSPSPTIGTSRSTPTNLRFIDPFKYDNYKPSARDEFNRKKSENAKDMQKDGKSLFFK